jgi:hypothetical protein
MFQQPEFIDCITMVVLIEALLRLIMFLIIFAYVIIWAFTIIF